MDFLRETVTPLGQKNCPSARGARGKLRRDFGVWAQWRRSKHVRWSIRVVPNRFPALGIEGELDARRWLVRQDEWRWSARVIVETPEHSASLASLPERRWKMFCGLTATGCWTEK